MDSYDHESCVVLVNVNFNKTKCAECSIRVYRSFWSECQHETNIWERLPCPLPFCIAVFYFKQSYCN